MTELTPDHAEEALAGILDNVVPTHGYQMVPLVGLDGSAGSISALRAFFRAMPTDSGQAFVVVLHLSPEHESTLPEILQRCTTMPVVQVNADLDVVPNNVYVIPPGKLIKTMNGSLALVDEPSGPRGRRMAVDHFFRTLADTHGPHAAAIVLSGADGDGAIGIKRIKERGGLTVAQDPQEAQHDGMPRSAIATGMVDWVLPVAEMGPRLLHYFELEGQLKLPSEEVSPEAQAAAPEARSANAAPAPRGAAEKRGLILVADDNVDAGWGVAKLLEIAGFATALAKGGHEALEQARLQQPDAGIFDIGMPDLNGYEVARRIRQADWGKHMVLIAATGWGQESDARAALDAGFDAHMTKPIDLGKLSALLDELLPRKR